MDDPETSAQPRLPKDWLTALLAALLLIAAFVLLTLPERMPAAERWAALTTFSVLALAYTLQGSPELYDGLGRTVRRSWGALGTLLLVMPVLYATYSLAVDRFLWQGLLAALAFVALPALLFAQSRQQRQPTLFDAAATLYILLVLLLDLVPTLTLPQQGGLIGFFDFATAPLLLLLLAARGWPGLGFTWFMSRNDLGYVLPWSLALVLVLAVIATVGGISQFVPGGFPPVLAPVVDELSLAVWLYFAIALPQELLFRGLIQNGVERLAEGWLWRGPGSFEQPGLVGQFTPQRIGLTMSTLLFTLAALVSPLAEPSHWLLVLVAGLVYGRVYQQTGKVTVAAIPHALVLWCWALFFV